MTREKTLAVGECLRALAAIVEHMDGTYGPRLQAKLDQGRRALDRLVEAHDAVEQSR